MEEILSAHEMALIQERLASEIIENNPGNEPLMLVGLQRRGADLTARLFQSLAGKISEISIGALDINLYRDDWTSRAGATPYIGKTDITGNMEVGKVLLIDDVLFTGRTIRAALEALLDYGRPKKVELLVFIDRGHRELPICANYVGRKIWTDRSQHVDVLFRERDGRDAVCLS